LNQHIQFLGFRSDVEKFAAIADVGVSSSKHEGLGLGLLEQMMCGVPVVASEDKGHREFVKHGVTGFLYPQGNRDAFVQSVRNLYEDDESRKLMGAAARRKAEEFSLDHSLAKMKGIYAGYHLTTSKQVT
jgi:glycosyltransferase EpsD